MFFTMQSLKPILLYLLNPAEGTAMGLGGEKRVWQLKFAL
jgi:hypothetical protein